MNVEEFQELQDKLTRLQRDKNRAEGALQGKKESLFNTFGVKSTKEAKTLLQELTKQEEELSEQFSQSLKEFEEAHGHTIS